MDAARLRFVDAATDSPKQNVDSLSSTACPLLSELQQQPSVAIGRRDLIRDQVGFRRLHPTGAKTQTISMVTMSTSQDAIP